MLYKCKTKEKSPSPFMDKLQSQTMEASIPSVYYNITIAIAVAGIIFLIVSKNTKTSRRRLPPSGPLSLPIIGHLYLLKPPLHQSLARIAARYGPILLLRFGSRSVLVISSADLAEECLTAANDVVFANRPPMAVTKYLLMKNIKSYNHQITIAPLGPHWRNRRRIATTHNLSSASVANLSFVRTAEVRSLLRRVYRSAVNNIDMRTALSDLMLNNIMQMMAGKRLCGDEGPRFLRRMHNIFEHVSGPSSLEDYLPFVRWLVNGGMKKLASLTAEMDVMVQSMVDEGRKRREVAEERTKSLVDAMLELQQDDPDNYSDEMIKGLTMELSMAGTDTVTGTLEWAMTMLLMHPLAQKKVRDEIQLHVGHDRLVADSDLPKLVYLKNVVKETLRLKPPTPLLIPHFSFDDSVIGGFDIPRETMLFVNVHAIHRDPKLWANPTEFVPERFDAEKGDGIRFMPFGMGRRKCPGENLAMATLQLTVASLIQCFEWEKVEEGEIDLTEVSGVTMRKAKPLEAKCKPCPTMIDVLSQL